MSNLIGLLLTLLMSHPPPRITPEMIQKALNKMKIGKTPGPSGIIAEMLKSAGDEGIRLLRMLTEAIFNSGIVPIDWNESLS